MDQSYRTDEGFFNLQGQEQPKPEEVFDKDYSLFVGTNENMNQIYQSHLRKKKKKKKLLRDFWKVLFFLMWYKKEFCL